VQKEDDMADVFDFELHETNAGNLDEDNDDDVILDDVRNLIASRRKITMQCPHTPPLTPNLIDKNIILGEKKQQRRRKITSH
jgi:hypothetical protein